MKLSRLPLASVARRARARIGALAAVVAIVAVSTVIASPASAMWIDDHTFRNGETGRCIAYPGWGEGVFASTNCSSSNGGVDWIITHWNDGTAQLKQYIDMNGTSRCLDDSYAYGLRMFSCHPGWSPYSIYQSWYYVGAGEPNFLLKNQATGRCVDDSFAYGLRAFPCNGLTFQQWRYFD